MLVSWTVLSGDVDVLASWGVDPLEYWSWDLVSLIFTLVSAEVDFLKHSANLDDRQNVTLALCGVLV